MQSSKTILYDFIKAVKKIDTAHSDTSYQKAVDDFLAKYPIQECQKILIDFLTKLYCGNFDRFYSANARFKLLALYERTNEMAMTTYMAQINQILNPN